MDGQGNRGQLFLINGEPEQDISVSTRGVFSRFSKVFGIKITSACHSRPHLRQISPESNLRLPQSILRLRLETGTQPPVYARSSSVRGETYIAVGASM